MLLLEGCFGLCRSRSRCPHLSSFHNQATGHEWERQRGKTAVQQLTIDARDAGRLVWQRQLHHASSTATTAAAAATQAAAACVFVTRSLDEVGDQWLVCVWKPAKTLRLLRNAGSRDTSLAGMQAERMEAESEWQSRVDE